MTINNGNFDLMASSRTIVELKPYLVLSLYKLLKKNTQYYNEKIEIPNKEKNN